MLIAKICEQHSTWRSIRVGCIPVIIADSLDIYAPIMKSSLTMSDHSIRMNEEEFFQDTEKVLMRLKDLDDAEIESKIKHLAFAQCVIFTDHPESLFGCACIFKRSKDGN